MQIQDNHKNKYEVNNDTFKYEKEKYYIPT